ncbi:hypothetical protein BKI52_10500 [marine bacterium AO1-C]|nr:hypothetical protein BKI52_10500 [marine bacterium AO1-C]
MKKITWTFFTQNQNKKEKAQKIAELLLEQMPGSELVGLEKYWKIENSYTFTIETNLGEDDFDTAVLKCLKISAKICGTWSVNYDENYPRFCLDFTKTIHSSFGRIEFNVITEIIAEVDSERFVTHE